MRNNWITKSLVIFIINTNIVKANCTPTPDCQSIGYTESSCDGKFIRCPFDTTKLFCIPCDNDYKYTCNDSNTFSGIGSPCNGRYASCECIEGASFYNGECVCNTTCSVGNIYYTDGTCSSCIISNKKIAGIIVKDNELIMSPLTSLPWGPTATDISSLNNISSEDYAKNDYNGRANTLSIVSELGENYTGSSGIYCYNYAPTDMENTKTQWYLPSYGELQTYICNNFTTLYPTTTKLGWQHFSQNFFWSSSENAYNLAWYAFSNNGHTNFDCGKNCTYRVTCLFSIK